MEILEGFVIKKKLYGESDYILTMFTREAGKVSGIAKYAKKSKKRFGGRLEPFLLLKISVKRNNNRLGNVSDVELVKAYKEIYEDIESFLVASFILEHLEILTPENEPIEELFDITVEALEKLNSGESVLQVLLSFQIKALGICGYAPGVGVGYSGGKNPGKEIFSIQDGGITDKELKVDNRNVFHFFNDIIVNPQTMDIYLSKVANNIKVLTRYTEYHTENKFKTSKFLEDLDI